MNNSAILKSLLASDKDIIIYRNSEKNNFELYTDFIEKINLNINNLDKFLNKLDKFKAKKKYDCYIGFFGYELLCKNLNLTVNKDKHTFPEGVFFRPQTKIVIDSKIDIFTKSKLDLIKSIKPLKNSKNISKNKIKVSPSVENYEKIFNKFKKNIKAGETYQIKIAQKYSNKKDLDIAKLFFQLMKKNLSPESFCIRTKEFNVISCSPENLFKVKGNKIVTSPIAGTVSRKKIKSTKQARQFFENNQKEDKEHNMIVDLERNDLSRITKPSSVKIQKLKFVQKYQYIYHNVSDISGTLHEKVKLFQIVKAMMPGGSVIGCPKINTLKLLNKEEKEPRRIYTGSFGYFRSIKDMSFNIIIRSILNFNNNNEVFVASGVILDSTAKNEYHENFLKAKSLLDLLK
jgi:anthranilate/para-aminobenzoate synthase component I